MSYRVLLSWVDSQELENWLVDKRSLSTHTETDATGTQGSQNVTNLGEDKVT